MGANAPHIRKFEEMMTGALGGKVNLDALGGDLRMLSVVESDGTIGLSDVTRVCGGKYSIDTISIFNSPLQLHTEHYEIDKIQEACTQCQSCPYYRSCGGGYLPHRYDGESFDNPSLYCDALYKLSERIETVLIEDLPSNILIKASGATNSISTPST